MIKLQAIIQSQTTLNQDLGTSFRNIKVHIKQINCHHETLLNDIELSLRWPRKEEGSAFNISSGEKFRIDVVNQT